MDLIIGDKATVLFKFLYNAEYIKENTTILLREGRTKILGKILVTHKEI